MPKLNYGNNFVDSEFKTDAIPVRYTLDITIVFTVFFPASSTTF